ncbi:MAG: polysaccharide export protein [Flavobacteriaceae bacterium]|nr:polysaccharide export protein [Flavobacteriaceae bacterium]
MKNVLRIQSYIERTAKSWKQKKLPSLSWSKLCLLFLAVLMSSCYSSSDLDYLQSEQYRYTTPVRTTEYIVQPNDVLDIKVQSMDPEQVAFFNLDNIDNRRQNANPASMYLTGYSINKEGKIRMAMVGDIKVGGLTVEEIRGVIQDEIDQLLLNATVSVKLTSFKVSVLGDVQNPGTYYVYNTQSTIFEALSKAGDLNISAKRRNVKLIRQEGDKNTVVNMDLTDPSIIRSPYYLMHPNDVIYVETSKQNIVRNNLSLFSILLSAVATSLLVFDVVSNN